MDSVKSDDSYLTMCRNAVRVRVPNDKSGTVNRLTILNALKGIQNGLIIPHIRTVTTTKRNIWLISFNESYDYSSLVGSKILINEQHFSLDDAQYPETLYKSFTFKFVGLKPNFAHEKIAKHLSSKGVKYEEIERIYEEHFQEEEFKHISKGTFRAKIKINATANPNYKNVLVNLVEQTQIDGNPQIARKKNSTCNKCKRTGHSADKCSLAKRITNNTYFDLADDEEDENLAQMTIEPNNDEVFYRNDVHVFNSKSTTGINLNSSQTDLPPGSRNQSCSSVLSNWESRLKTLPSTSNLDPNLDSLNQSSSSTKKSLIPKPKTLSKFKKTLKQSENKTNDDFKLPNNSNRRPSLPNKSSSVKRPSEKTFNKSFKRDKFDGQLDESEVVNEAAKLLNIQK
ncbi:hypothetical protein BpHYR1_032572 [Brachionus plicatilis]|uniref:CCHC-type domain-containing protein n=1 Tax=Brachionus plicatilis TaxID=10195 RepID=A0A3M7PF25_BRAPC|nr:hypothetical protein BpHYR1_032572 [Brachionus plicatilis]